MRKKYNKQITKKKIKNMRRKMTMKRKMRMSNKNITRRKNLRGGVKRVWEEINNLYKPFKKVSSEESEQKEYNQEQLDSYNSKEKLDKVKQLGIQNLIDSKKLRLTDEEKEKIIRINKICIEKNTANAGNIVTDNTDTDSTDTDSTYNPDNPIKVNEFDNFYTLKNILDNPDEDEFHFRKMIAQFFTKKSIKTDLKKALLEQDVDCDTISMAGMARLIISDQIRLDIKRFLFMKLIRQIQFKLKEPANIEIANREYNENKNDDDDDKNESTV
jgi:hypothetical protein